MDDFCRRFVVLVKLVKITAHSLNISAQNLHKNVLYQDYFVLSLIFNILNKLNDKSMYSKETGQSIIINLNNTAYAGFDHLSKYLNIISPFSRIYFIEKGEGEMSCFSRTFKKHNSIPPGQYRKQRG
jgi:hypothetical protein